MIALEYVLLGGAILGHAALWVVVYNRNNALGLACWLHDIAEKAVFLMVVGMPAAYALWRWSAALPLAPPLDSYGDSAGTVVLGCYLAFCWACLGYVLARWSWRKLHAAPPQALLQNESRIVAVTGSEGRPLFQRIEGQLLGLIPGNESLTIEVNEKVLRCPQLPAALDGLSIVHLSDLHYTGKIAREFFERAVAEANALAGDLVAVTGDLVDKPRYLDWIAPTLGHLRARHGVYFVLGNHDRRHDAGGRVRKAVCNTGLCDLGGKALLLEVRGARLLLAGNERPWYCHLPELPERQSGEIRILLAHTPDQFGWARRCDFELMLAGHTHGGQIVLPFIGPLVSPSLYGVTYAGGLFHAPPTIMHVSRGLSGEHPIRLGCRPELTKLVLVRG